MAIFRISKSLAIVSVRYKGTNTCHGCISWLISVEQLGIRTVVKMMPDMLHQHNTERNNVLIVVCACL